MDDAVAAQWHAEGLADLPLTEKLLVWHHLKLPSYTGLVMPSVEARTMLECFAASRADR